MAYSQALNKETKLGIGFRPMDVERHKTREDVKRGHI